MILEHAEASLRSKRVFSDRNYRRDHVYGGVRHTGRGDSDEDPPSAGVGHRTYIFSEFKPPCARVQVVADALCFKEGIFSDTDEGIRRARAEDSADVWHNFGGVGAAGHGLPQ